METTSTTQTRHPVLACAAEITQALKNVSDVDPMFMTTPEKAQALLEVTRLTGQLEAFRLRLISASGDVAEQDGSKNVGTWLGPRTLTDTAANTAAQHLAEDLSAQWTQVGAGLGDGRVNLAQARVIVRALNALGAEVDPDLVKKAEAHLVAQATHFGPKQLKVLGDKILEVIAPDAYEDEERKKLQAQQRRANAATRLGFKKRGDGATDIHARVPDSVAARLAAYLNAFTNPRKAGEGDGSGDGTGDGSGDGPITDPLALAVVDRGGSRHLSFRFPNTDALLAPTGDSRGFAGPATIAVTRAGLALPCGLATAPCVGQSGLLACIDAFFTDLREHHAADNVLMFLFTEFGRRVHDNGSGTDHGAGGV